MKSCLLIIFFSAVIAIILAFYDFTQATSGGTGFGPLVCARHGFGDDKWCIDGFSQDPGNKQIYSYDMSSEAHGHGSSTDFELHVCISQWFGSRSGICRARLWYDYPHEDGVWRPFDSWSESESDYKPDWNYVNFHIYVRDGELRVTANDRERRVSIDSFNPPSGTTKSVGNPFTVDWATDWPLVPEGVTLIWSGPLSGGSGSGKVLEDGSRTFTCSSPGTANFELQATGPGGNGVITETQTRTVECVSPPPPPPPPSGRYKCTGVGSGCAFVEGETGPDQCSPPSDPVCLVPLPTADLKCNL